MAVTGGFPQDILPSVAAWITYLLVATTSNGVITEQCPHSCTCIEELNGTYVNCKAQDFRRIPDDIPNDATILDLGYNMLSEFSTVSLPVMGNVKVLKLDNNEITTLFNDAFQKFPDLDTLSLASNQIMDIRENAFRGLPHLRHLDLQDNKLNHMHVAIANKLNLESLNLDNNLIQIFPTTDTVLGKISELHLDNNDILHLAKSDFGFLNGSLTSFYLSHNQRPLSIDKHTFEDFVFNHISLSYNRIKNVRFIENLTTRKLDLSGNQFDISHFQGYPSVMTVEELRLVNCSIESLDAEYFYYLVNLSILDLSKNNLRVLSHDVFKYNSNLRVLTLNENRLSDFKVSIPSLEILSLSYNQIRKVTPAFFSDFQLLELDLSYNLIQVLGEVLYQFIDTIPTLNFHANPFHCNCEMRWFREWLAARQSFTGVYNCSSPSPGFIMQRRPDEFVCKQPVIRFISPDVIVEEGGELLLSCTGEGDPAPVIAFETPLEGPEYSVSPPLDRTKTRNFAAYKLTRVDVKQGGVYICNATNAAGSTSKSINVTVLSNATLPSSPPVVIVTMHHSTTSSEDDDIESTTASTSPVAETFSKSKTKISALVKIVIIVCVSLVVPMLMLVMYFVVRYAKHYRNSERYIVYTKQKTENDRLEYYNLHDRPPKDRKSNGIAMV